MRRKLTNNRLAAFLVIGFTAVILLCIGAVACNALRSPGSGGVEVEDCDAEDRRNKETECGFTDTDRRSPKPVVKPSPAKANTVPARTPAKPNPVKTK